MRRSNDSSFVSHEGAIVGVNLGADFTAEHEVGIAPLKAEFDIPVGPKDWGLVRRKITRLPVDFGWTTGYDKKGEGLYLCDSWDNKKPDFSGYSELRPIMDKTLSCAWDDGSFAVFSTLPEEIKHLREIYEAFVKLDGVVFLGGGGIWQNSGLILAIASRIPQEFRNKWYDIDKDRYDIDREVEESGIRKLLADKGKRYFALSPSRNADGSIRFWLNPMEQKQNNYGWFSLEDLKEWAEDKGKIPMVTGGKR